MADFAHMQQET